MGNVTPCCVFSAPSCTNAAILCRRFELLRLLSYGQTNLRPVETMNAHLLDFLLDVSLICVNSQIKTIF